MTETEKLKATEPGTRPRVPLPVGYRQGIISAITLILGFSLLFLRYWNFEAPGVWSGASVAAALLLVLSILLQFMTLWRSLQIEDDDEQEYRKTLRFFLGATFTLFVSLLIATVATSHLFNL